MCEPSFNICDLHGSTSNFNGSTSYVNGSTSNIKKTQGLGVSALKKSLMIHKYKKLDSRKLTSDSLLISDGNDNLTPGEQILKEYRCILE